MTTLGADTEPRELLPRGLIVLLGMTGLLVTILALQQFAVYHRPGPARARARHQLSTH